MEIAKCLLGHRTKLVENIVFEHTTNNISDAKKAALLKYPEYKVLRAWIGVAGQHKLARLPESNSKLVKSLMENTKKENVLFDEVDY